MPVDIYSYIYMYEGSALGGKWTKKSSFSYSNLYSRASGQIGKSDMADSSSK